MRTDDAQRREDLTLLLDELRGVRNEVAQGLEGLDPMMEEPESLKMVTQGWVASTPLLLGEFRRVMFSRLVPNLRFIGLLDERMERHYAAAGLLGFAAGRNASELSGDDMLHELDRAAAADHHAAA